MSAAGGKSSECLFNCSNGLSERSYSTMRMATWTVSAEPGSACSDPRGVPYKIELASPRRLAREGPWRTAVGNDVLLSVYRLSEEGCFLCSSSPSSRSKAPGPVHPLGGPATGAVERGVDCNVGRKRRKFQTRYFSYDQESGSRRGRGIRIEESSKEHSGMNECLLQLIRQVSFPRK